MDSNLKQRWVSDLRSGKYVQCRFSLSEEDSYCCLGVLYHISATDQEKRTTPPYTFIDDTVGGLSISHKLANMNDSEGKTFSEIADWIEQNL